MTKVTKNIGTNMMKGTGNETSVTPTISVVIPCFNDGKYIGETLDKLRQQTFKDFEIIIVNDGSTDKLTIDILHQINKSGLARVLHKTNGRMSSARNYGVLFALGSVIATIDADDYFHSTFLAKALDLLVADPEVAVVTSYIQLFGDIRSVAKPRAKNAFNFMFSSQIPACAMVRKSCWDEVGGYDESMINGYEDWEFYIRIAKKGWAIKVIPEKLLFYRQTQKSTLKNSTGPNRAALIGYIVDKHKDWFLDNLKVLMTNQEVIYTEARISWQRIFKMIKDRITHKHK